MTRPPRRPGPIGLEVTALIREAMGRKMMNQADLVRATGIQQATLSRALLGQRELGIDELEAIAQALGTSSGRLIDDAIRATGRTKERFAESVTEPHLESSDDDVVDVYADDRLQRRAASMSQSLRPQSTLER